MPGSKQAGHRRMVAGARLRTVGAQFRSVPARETLKGGNRWTRQADRGTR